MNRTGCKVGQASRLPSAKGASQSRPLRGQGRRDVCRNLRMTQRGMALIDCLAYIAMLALILGMAFLAFYRATDHSRDLSYNAADIARALSVGERWREDVRSATTSPRLDRDGGFPLLRLPHAGGEIAYAFHDGAVFRRALPNTNWVALLPAVAASMMRAEPRRQITSWHWDVELKGRQKVARLRPVFSFEAVNATAGKP